MKINMGSIDRAIRIVVGIALLALLALADAPQRWWGLFGIPLVFLTAVIGWCPAYSIFRVSTREHSPS